MALKHSINMKSTIKVSALNSSQASLMYCDDKQMLILLRFQKKSLLRNSQDKPNSLGSLTLLSDLYDTGQVVCLVSTAPNCSQYKSTQFNLKLLKIILFSPQQNCANNISYVQTCTHFAVPLLDVLCLLSSNIYAVTMVPFIAR